MTSKATQQKTPEKRETVVKARFNEDELRRLDATRHKLGYASRSALLRDIPAIAERGGGREYKTVVVDRAALALRQEIIRLRLSVDAVGRNLNQLARQANRSGATSFMVIPISEARDELAGLRKRLDALEPEAVSSYGN